MNDCPICLEPCESDFVVTECCQNHFHTSCHTECMKVKNSCPLCRHVVIEVENEPQLVEVRVSCISFRLICACIGATLLLGFFGGFMMYFMIDNYLNQSLNNTTSNNVTSDVHN